MMRFPTIAPRYALACKLYTAEIVRYPGIAKSLNLQPQ